MTVRSFLPAAIPVIAFTAVAALFFAALQRQDEGGLPSNLVGKPAPTIVPDSLEGFGRAPNAADFETPKVKLVNFWASWCAPCRVEHPQLQWLAENRVDILGINYKDEPRQAADFLTELGNPFAKTGADPEGRAALQWGVYGVPETFIVDADGIVRLRWAGPITRNVLENHIVPAIDAAGSR
ncbi:MAG: DsbE family thiol:disulfide interchange protein [Rhodobacteraceae bacterium]|nr:DsbE family thiol:disulfide interchange protein [Paracoccaceae bacterium]